MNLPTEQPTQLSIDVQQWRRDIQTFSATTIQALNAIAGELSGGYSGATVGPTNQAMGHSPVQPANESSGDDRLAKLKSHLAQRISKTN